jgi:hypothetical protein
MLGADARSREERKMTAPSDPRTVNGVKILGPDLLARDADGQALSPIATVFPHYRAVVTGRGIHGMQVGQFIDYLAAQVFGQEGHEFQYEDEDLVYQDAVALLVHGQVVLIRSEPEAMERMFEADEVLQLLVPKDQIQFTGAYLEQVRAQLRSRGESWRISQPPRSVEEMCLYIQRSRASVGTGAVYYHNPQTGSRFLTYQEFERIRPLIRADCAEALARLKEIVQLTRLINNQGVRELALFLPNGKALEVYALERVIADLASCGAAPDVCAAEARFDQFAEAFAAGAGEDLLEDDEKNAAWRTGMFCRLSDINEKAVEECVLGLSQEFYLNIRWVRGARIVTGQLLFEPEVELRVRNLITHFWKSCDGLVSINVGRVEMPQNPKRRPDERRDVLLIVLGFGDAREEVHIARMAKWDVIHRLKQGKPLAQAVAETEEYCRFIFDRLHAATELGMPIPAFTMIRLKDEMPGSKLEYPVFFFSRGYVSGMVSDKLPGYRYGGEHRDRFIVCLAACLGHAATASLVLGRADAFSETVHFDDGDEIVQLDDAGVPCRVTIAETTGSFANWWTPMRDLLPQCLQRLTEHLAKARAHGASAQALDAAVAAFERRFLEELGRVQELVRRDSDRLHGLFADRPNETGGIRFRWEHVLARVANTDLAEVRRVMSASGALAAYRLRP